MKSLSTVLVIAAFLPLSIAHRAIETYERNYWGVDPGKVSHCRRHSPRQVSCISEAQTTEGTYITEDWATRIGNGDIRVHPGKFMVIS